MPKTEVVELRDIDPSDVDLVGGKAANLAALLRLGDVRVPDGFCVTTAAFRRSMTADLVDAIAAALARRAPETAWAVRSSATAEDGGGASFAGQHDTFLDVRGVDAVVDAIGRCWASLTSERAVAYRRQAGIDDGDVAMAVVVQELVDPIASGVLFTAHPLTGNRRDTVVEAVAGLGEALVSGRAEADSWTVRNGVVTASAGAGAVLADDDVLAVAAVGRRIEAAFGAPQDIEWCIDGDGIAVVQSRPITTLFPIPVRDDDAPHLYLSVGHQQMMTDPFRALGWSLWQRQAMTPMFEAGGRLWVDVAVPLSMPGPREGLLAMTGRSDPLTGDALRTALGVDDALPPPAPSPAPIDPDPELVARFVDQGHASTEALRVAFDGVSGAAVFDVIGEGIDRLKTWLTDPAHGRLIMAGMEASWWLDDHLGEWLGERGAVDRLTRSAPGNVTSAMGLALAEVADLVRPHPALVAFLEQADDGFVDDLAAAAERGDLPGAAEVHDAIVAFLDRYGMRCAGEIDVTRPRWHERPSALLGPLLADVRHLAPGEAARRFERGEAEAEAEERAILARLRALPDGEAKAAEAEQMIRRVRTFIGYREFPKFVIVSQLDLHRRALWREAEALAEAGVLAVADDLAHLTFDEARDVVEHRRADRALIERRKAEHRVNATLTPPRVLTSEGEALHGRYRRNDAPEGALVGLGVSAGVVEGTVRVVDDPAGVVLGPGEILVTAHTDPSWSPLFVAATGLITEVGGLMTHGAVVAREYGLPAIVGVVDATTNLRDGQRVRLDGTSGTVVPLV